MGNSGWCVSKNAEVEYQAGEESRSSNSGLKFGQQKIEISSKFVNANVITPTSDKNKVSKSIEKYLKHVFLVTVWETKWNENQVQVNAHHKKIE